jgi:hypothetical protein
MEEAIDRTCDQMPSIDWLNPHLLGVDAGNSVGGTLVVLFLMVQTEKKYKQN